MLNRIVAIGNYAGYLLSDQNNVVAVGENSGGWCSNSVSIGDNCKSEGEHQMWVNGRKIEMTPEEVDAVIDAFLKTKSVASKALAADIEDMDHYEQAN